MKIREPQQQQQQHGGAVKVEGVHGAGDSVSGRTSDELNKYSKEWSSANTSCSVWDDTLPPPQGQENDLTHPTTTQQLLEIELKQNVFVHIVRILALGVQCMS